MKRIRKFLENKPKRKIIKRVLDENPHLDDVIDRSVKLYIKNVKDVDDRILIYFRQCDWHKELYQKIQDDIIRTMDRKGPSYMGRTVSRVLSRLRDDLMKYAMEEANPSLMA